MTRFPWLLSGFAAVASLAACSVYGSNLVGTGGSGGTNPSTPASSSTSGSTTTAATTSTTGPGAGGGMACTAATTCPGMVTECQQPACIGGLCQLAYAASGMVLTAQTKGDCQKLVCDGQGNTTSQEDDTDTPDDKNGCTLDACAAGMPKYSDQPKSTACTDNGGSLCNASGKCVQCLVPGDCTSGVCNAANMCVSSQCNDHVKNGSETDVDCGGGSCPTCGPGKACGANGDCLSMMCVGGLCAGSCTDQVKDGTETDIDCGGTCPSACPSGKKCGANVDCQSGDCVAGVCQDVLVISQVQSRGDLGGNDEFVELYNPTSIPVTFDASWVVKARSALGGLAACANNSLATRFAGTGLVIPAHGHILYVNNTVPAYNGPTPGDGTYTIGVPDAAAVVLLHGNTVVDALCFYFDQPTQDTLTMCPAAYPCEGTPSLNPHNNTSSSNADKSLERLPGGAMGNTVDTNDNVNDFGVATTADPHGLLSASTP